MPLNSTEFGLLALHQLSDSVCYLNALMVNKCLNSIIFSIYIVNGISLVAPRLSTFVLLTRLLKIKIYRLNWDTASFKNICIIDERVAIQNT